MKYVPFILTCVLACLLSYLGLDVPSFFVVGLFAMYYLSDRFTPSHSELSDKMDILRKDYKEDGQKIYKELLELRAVTYNVKNRVELLEQNLPKEQEMFR